MNYFRHALFFTICLAICPAAFSEEIPWWDDVLTIIQVGDAEHAMKSNASAVLCGVADDPCWGIFAQRQRMVAGRNTIKEMQANSQKVMVWFEGFGTTQSNVAQIRKNPDGSWIKDHRDDTLTAVVHHHWNWERFDGTGVVQWLGLPNYFDCDDFVSPWTMEHPEYGCVPMCYPDGSVANGYRGDASDPRNSLVWDAGCSKDVLGRVSFEYSFNEKVNSINPETKQLHGPLDGLVRVEQPQLGPPDPGYTPEEWKALKSSSYAGVVSAGKDTACPIWFDYLESSLKDALSIGADGLWVDNYSPWDSFNAMPLIKAFGEWSVAEFRPFLKNCINCGIISEKELYDLGVNDLVTFDIRDYLCQKCCDFGGNPENFHDAAWKDPRWQDDLLWRAYLVHKRQVGTAAFERYYSTVKKIAKEAGKPDFFVSGNDIPVYSLGWIRGELDMVSTELTWGWHLTSGPRGFMPPPFGCYIPVAKLGREHAKSRFVNAWYYVPKEHENKPNIAKVINYQGLANHVLPMPQYSSHTIGTPEVNSEFFAFVRDLRPTIRYRIPYGEQIGVYYSSSDQVMEMLPGGFKNHNDQPHSFGIYGWGTILTQLHYAWRAVPQWKFTEENLAPLNALIMSNVAVFDRRQLPILKHWVESGGTLILSGEFANRHDEEYLFAKAPPLDTAFLPEVDSAFSTKPLGKGRMIFIKNDSGDKYYKTENGRFDALNDIRPYAENILSPTTLKLDARSLPPEVGVTLYQDSEKFFVDLNNTNIDISNDSITPVEEVTFIVELPETLHGKDIVLQCLSPDSAARATFQKLENNRIQLTAGPFELYTCLMIEMAP